MIIYFIILAAAALRFIPHMPNFAPITAVAIFSAANMDWKKSVGLTFGARLISDLFLGFFSWPLMVAVYASHLVGILFGLWIKRSSAVIPDSGPESISKIMDPGSRVHSAGTTEAKWLKIILSSLGSSVVFFLVTNFAFLYADYPHNFAGIILAYTNGLPFLRGTLLGDMGYSVALFGGYALAKYIIRIYRLRTDLQMSTDI